VEVEMEMNVEAVRTEKTGTSPAQTEGISKDAQIARDPEIQNLRDQRESIVQNALVRLLNECRQGVGEKLDAIPTGMLDGDESIAKFLKGTLVKGAVDLTPYVGGIRQILEGRLLWQEGYSSGDDILMSRGRGQFILGVTQLGLDVAIVGYTFVDEGGTLFPDLWRFLLKSKAFLTGTQLSQWRDPVTAFADGLLCSLSFTRAIVEFPLRLFPSSKVFGQEQTALLPEKA
jgi:hypothetical protein